MRPAVPFLKLSDIEQFPDPAADTDGRLAKVCQILFNPLLLPMVTTGLPLGSAQPPRFKLHKLRSGGKHAVIVVNGFLSKGDRGTSDWEDALAARFGRATWYHLDWDAFRHPLAQAADLLTIDGMLDRMVGKREPALLAGWHTTMLAAERAGELLAQAILSTPGWRFTLAGHSLGARVIHFALKALEGKGARRIENVYLLGGAVGGADVERDKRDWTSAANAVKGRIFNCFSDEDGVLAWLYQGANALQSRPVGLHGIRLKHERIFHFDCSPLVTGHMRWKENFGHILRQLKAY
ncbi:DUF726 domain-containing protein [uncultured Massilia sp.]|uniref:DUF726 domain-containing protein n=1 Tax=uncultured Massilia sp. TaxID=169973 RepID=UPI0025DB3468|nr:DUF726 domain-containing protein [uncultured Massilia sp.]